MLFKCVKTGDLATNCYILGCSETKEAVIIDPGFSNEDIDRFIEEEELNIKYIINTHGHADHVSANKYYKEKTNADILIHEKDAEILLDPTINLSQYIGINVNGPVADKVLNEGDIINFGNIELKVIHTPGHTMGGICLIGDKFIFTGDTLFCGSVGRTDFPNSSTDDLMNSIKNKIVPLEKDYILYPGHGPSTTLQKEKENNPFLV